MTIHYNGHGIVTLYEKDKSKAGLWSCSNDKDVGIEDFMELIKAKA